MWFKACMMFFYTKEGILKNISNKNITSKYLLLYFIEERNAYMLKTLG